MAKGIDITKYKEEKGIHYYFISKGDRNPLVFIGIDPKNKIILFYKNSNFNAGLLDIIDLKDKNPIKSIPGIERIDLIMTVARAHLAIHKKEFPKYIGIQV